MGKNCDHWTHIGSDNGLSPGRRQAIIWTSAGILLIGPLWTNFSEILIRMWIFSFKEMQLKMSSAKCRPFCLGLNVLKKCNLPPFPFQKFEKKIMTSCGYNKQHIEKKIYKLLPLSVSGSLWSHILKAVRPMLTWHDFNYNVRQQKHSVYVTNLQQRIRSVGCYFNFCFCNISPISSFSPTYHWGCTSILSIKKTLEPKDVFHGWGLRPHNLW